MSLATLMNCTVTIKSQSQAKDPLGGRNTPTLSTVASNVPARFSIMKPQVAEVYYGKYGVNFYARIYFASNPNLTPVTSWITYNGTDYEVLNIINAGGYLNELWEADCLRKTF